MVGQNPLCWVLVQCCFFRIHEGEIHSSRTDCKSAVYTMGHSDTSKVTISVGLFFFITRKTEEFKAWFSSSFPQGKSAIPPLMSVVLHRSKIGVTERWISILNLLQYLKLLFLFLELSPTALQHCHWNQWYCAWLKVTRNKKWKRVCLFFFFLKCIQKARKPVRSLFLPTTFSNTRNTGFIACCGQPGEAGVHHHKDRSSKETGSGNVYIPIPFLCLCLFN